MIKTAGVVLAFGGSIIAAGLFLSHARDHVAFFSEESKTLEGAPVANAISFSKQGVLDIWMMNQSHSGAGASAEKWDRIAIVVNRDKKTAKFYQLKPGKLKWEEPVAEQEFKVSCRVCHANGPRAIRPLEGLDGKALDFADAFQIWKWNLKIKAYGHLTASANESLDGKKRLIPFQLQGEFANERLKVGICVSCHRDSGPFAHGALTRQNSITIKHMVESGHMPPLGIPLIRSQKLELQRFLSGL